MDQHLRIQEFKIKNGDETPFKIGKGGSGPSGSKWATKELNWLAVHFQDECKLDDVFTPESELSGQVAKYVRSELHTDEALDWHALCKRKFPANHFYSRLCFLDTAEEKQPYYTPSATIGTQASSVLKEQQSQQSPSQSSESSSAGDRQLSLTPTPRPRPLKMHKKPKDFAIESSPLSLKPSNSLKIQKITRESKRDVFKDISTKTLFDIKDLVES